MCATKWFFFTYLAIQVEALTDPFMDFLVDEALKNLRQVVDDPTDLPSVDAEDQMGTEMSMAFGSVKLENGELVGLKTVARTDDVRWRMIIDEESNEPKLHFSAFLGIGEAIAHHDAIISFFGFEAFTPVSVSITDLQILLLAEKNLQEGWKVLDFKFITGWPSTVISVEGATGMGADFVEIGLEDQLIISVEPSLMDQFEDSLNLPSMELLRLANEFGPSGISDELLEFIELIDF